jgi:hypothetical protein
MMIIKDGHQAALENIVGWMIFSGKTLQILDASYWG